MRVPTYEKQTSRVTPTVSTPQELRPPAAAFGTEMAEATTRLGETGMKIASAIMQRAAERRKELMAKQVTEQDTMFRQEMQNVLYNDQVDKNGKPLGFLSRKLDQTQNITPEFDQTYSNIRKKYLNNVAAPEQKDALAKMLDSTYLSHRDNVIRYERNEIDKSIQNSFKSNLDIQVNDAAQLQDGPSVIRAIDAAIVTQDTLSKINGYDAATAENERMKITGRIAANVLSSVMVDNDLIRGRLIYEAVKGKIPAKIEEEFRDAVENKIPYGIALNDAMANPEVTMKKLQVNGYDIKDPKIQMQAIEFATGLSKKRQEEFAFLQAKARNEKEQQLSDAYIKGALTIDTLNMEYSSKQISDEFYKSMLAVLSNPIKLEISSLDKVIKFNELVERNTDIAKREKAWFGLEQVSFEDITKFRADVFNANAKGYITDTEMKNLLGETSKTFYRDPVFQNALSQLATQSKLYATPETQAKVKAEMYGNLIEKVIAGKEPRQAVIDVIREKLATEVGEAIKAEAQANRIFAKKGKQRIYSDDDGVTWKDEKTNEVIK